MLEAFLDQVSIPGLDCGVQNRKSEVPGGHTGHWRLELNNFVPQIRKALMVCDIFNYILQKNTNLWSFLYEKE